MERLRGWWREVASPTALTFPSVTKLEISGCESLVENMPVFDAVEDLILSNISSILMYLFLCYSIPQGSLNSKLQVLNLSDILGLECLPEGLVKHLTALRQLEIFGCWYLRWVSRRGLACLTSLETLRIYGCGNVRLEDEDDDSETSTEISTSNNNMYTAWQSLRKLQTPWQRDLLKEGLRFLTSLQELNMTYYEEQHVEADNQNSECCTCAPEKLQKVTLFFGRMSTFFPKWVMHLPSLTELSLWKCGEMNVDDWVAQQTQSTTLLSLTVQSDQDDSEFLWLHDFPWKLLPSLHTLILDGQLSSIPDGIQQLTSLQYLLIIKCSNLKEIPKWFVNLTSLQCLAINECSPELVARCDRETGIDWHLISHIPGTIEITGTFPVNTYTVILVAEYCSYEYNHSP